MLANDLALRLLLPSASQQLYLADDRAADVDARAIVARLRVAEQLLPDDPDAAALLLDGVLAAIAALPRSGAGECDERFSLCLRLALRAPNVEARLAHCRDLLWLIEADKGDQRHVGVG